jgi:hypothetical protein
MAHTLPPRVMAIAVAPLGPDHLHRAVDRQLTVAASCTWPVAAACDAAADNT